MHVRALVRLARFALLPLLLASCGGGGPDEDRLENRNPGNNDLNVVVAFGDSITPAAANAPANPIRSASRP